MTCNEIISNIVVPILSAIIGGALTLVGVWLTIHRDKKRDEDNLKKSVKPWIFSEDNFDHYDYKDKNYINMAVSSESVLNNCFKIYIKNTDNGIGIVDKLVTKNQMYIPVFGEILEKNKVTSLNIYYQDKCENLQDMSLYIKDVYGNPYKYKVQICNNNNKKWTIKEVPILK